MKLLLYREDLKSEKSEVGHWDAEFSDFKIDVQKIIKSFGRGVFYNSMKKESSYTVIYPPIKRKK